MKYSQQLIDEVRRVFPNCPEYHEMAEKGDTQLITALNSMSDGQISNNEILEELSRGEAGRRNLFNRAQRLEETKNLYFMAVQEFEDSEDQENAEK